MVSEVEHIDFSSQLLIYWILHYWWQTVFQFVEILLPRCTWAISLPVHYCCWWTCCLIQDPMYVVCSLCMCPLPFSPETSFNNSCIIVLCRTRVIADFGSELQGLPLVFRMGVRESNATFVINFGQQGGTELLLHNFSGVSSILTSSVVCLQFLHSLSDSVDFFPGVSVFPHIVRTYGLEM